MSFAHLLATGNGALGVRLEIEGLAVQFVSEPSMERDLDDGRRRVCCLPPVGKGITIEETVNLPEALLEAQGTSIQLLETEDEALAQVFAWRPDREWWVTSTIDVSDSTVNLLGTTGITAGDVLHIGTEAMRVDSVASTSVVVDRGWWGTIAQTHQSDADGVPLRTIMNRPLAVRGRRAYLWLYGEGDDLQGTGTRVWVGHVSSNPRVTEAGSAWGFQLGSIAERLKTKIGGELEQPLRPRGIYYHWAAPLRVWIEEHHGTDRRIAGTNEQQRLFVGFFETQEAFAAAFTTWLADLVTTYSSTALDSVYRAVVLADGTWTIECVSATGVTNVVMQLNSEADGRTAGPAVEPYSRGDSTIVPLPDPGGLTPGTTLRPPWFSSPPGARMVPRGFFGRSRASDGDPLNFAALFAVTTHPHDRVYTHRAVSAGWNSLAIEWTDGTSRRTAAHAIVDRSTTDNWVRATSVDPSTRDVDTAIRAVYTEQIPLLMRVTRALVVTGDLADLRDTLVAIGPAECNRGSAPFLTSADLADWRPAVRVAARRPWQAQRSLILAQPTDLEELLSHECRLLSLFPVIDSNGRIAMQSLEVLTGGLGPTPVQIDDELVSVGWSTMERANQTVNRVVVKSGYDAVEDEWKGDTYDTSDATSFAQDHTDRPLTIEPRTIEFRRPSYDDVIEGILPTLHAFAYPHDFVSVNVSWKLFNVRLGDVVEFSGHHLPDYNRGVRPLVRARAVVVGRRWQLGEAHGELRLLVPWVAPAGYSPTARIVSQTDNGGNEWTLTVDPSMYAPSGRTVPEFFEAGYIVQIIQYDSASPVVRDGTVTNVNVGTNQIEVQLTASWTPGSSTWELCYGAWDDVSDDQQRYAYIASADGTLDGAMPKTFAA